MERLMTKAAESLRGLKAEYREGQWVESVSGGEILYEIPEEAVLPSGEEAARAPSDDVGDDDSPVFLFSVVYGVGARVVDEDGNEVAGWFVVRTLHQARAFVRQSFGIPR